MFPLTILTLLLYVLIEGAIADDRPDYYDPKYVPAPSVGHELGIMFAFIGAMVVSMLLYMLVWQMGNRRSTQQEKERVEAMRRSGYLDARRAGSYDMKAKDEGTELRE